MTYLGVELDQARALAAALGRAANLVDALARDVVQAHALADVPVLVDGMLNEIRVDCLLSAARIERAVQLLENYRLVLPWFWRNTSDQLQRSPGSDAQMVPFVWAPEPARWDGVRDTPWNLVHQESSHNSYAAGLGLVGLYDLGIRSFEFDIHRGAPTNFESRPSFLWEVPVDHATHSGGRGDDWWVYHTSFDPDSEFEGLIHGLTAVADLPATDPLTIFIDVKDAFGATYSPELLDVLLVQAFGDRLYVPANVTAQAGWPTIEELQSRVIVVLTGVTANYDSAAPRAFVSGVPVFATGASGAIVHVPDPTLRFYNQRRQSISAAEVAAVAASGSILRTYGHVGCGDEGETRPNYRVMDIEAGGARCFDDS